MVTIPTVGWSDVSLQWPTSTNTTIADHDRHWGKWPPSAPHEALQSVPARHMDGRQPPELPDVIFWGVEGVYGPQNTPMLGRFIIAGTKERPYTPSTPGECNLFIRSIGTEHKASCGALEGHFRRWRPWLWWLWRELCFVIRLLKVQKKTLRLVVCSQCLYV